jgi:hypothetical protein
MTACNYGPQIMQEDDDTFYITEALLIMYPSLVITDYKPTETVPNKLLILCDPQDRGLELDGWCDVHKDIQATHNYAAIISDHMILVSELLADKYIAAYSDQGFHVEVINV